VYDGANTINKNDSKFNFQNFVATSSCCFVRLALPFRSFADPSPDIVREYFASSTVDGILYT
jgi:hypothetical protein